MPQLFMVCFGLSLVSFLWQMEQTCTRVLLNTCGCLVSVVSLSALSSPKGIVPDVPDASFNGLYQLHRIVHIFWKKTSAGYRCIFCFSIEEACPTEGQDEEPQPELREDTSAKMVDVMPRTKRRKLTHDIDVGLELSIKVPQMKSLRAELTGVVDHDDIASMQKT